MSNITREELHRIYDTYHIVFLNIAKEAAKFGVDLTANISDNGTISLKASDYSDKEVIRNYEISQNDVDITYHERRFKRNS